MIEAVFFLGIGLAFLVILVLWVHRSSTPVIAPEAVSQVHEILTAVQLELPSRTVGERIFALPDWEFVAQQPSRFIQRRFLNERKAIALSWLSETQGGLQRLMQFHRRAVRGTASLKPEVEIRLALSYFSFMLVYELLCGLIRLRGPFAVQKTIGYALGMADQLSYLSGHALVGMDPVRLSRIQNRWSSGPAAS